MDLKDSWRQKRLRGREKVPLSPSLFSHVGGLVRGYHLGEEFCRLMRSMTAEGIEKLARNGRGQAKVPYEPPLFFLATPEEYLAIREIIAGLENPYLRWAHSPEEMLLSPHLWRQRPGLDKAELGQRHLAALF